MNRLEKLKIHERNTQKWLDENLIMQEMDGGFILRYIKSLLLTSLIVPIFTVLAPIAFLYYLAVLYLNKILSKKYVLARCKEVMSIIEKYGNDCYINEGILMLDMDINIDSDKSLEDFLYDFTHVYNQGYPTLHKESRYVQCTRNRRRSLGDIYLICKNYYPDCTIHDVLRILIKFLEQRKVSASFCGMIHKYVFHVETDRWVRDGMTEYDTEYSKLRFNEVIDAYNNIK